MDLKVDSLYIQIPAAPSLISPPAAAAQHGSSAVLTNFAAVNLYVLVSILAGSSSVQLAGYKQYWHKTLYHYNITTMRLLFHY